MFPSSTSSKLFRAYVAIGLVALGWSQVAADRDQALDQSNNYNSNSPRGPRISSVDGKGLSQGYGQMSNNAPNSDKRSAQAGDPYPIKQASEPGYGGPAGYSDKALGTQPGPFDIVEWCKLMFNPVELVKSICVHFKLDFEQVSGAIGRHVIYGAEALLTPLVVTTKIVEKVFVPDSCRLKFVCKMGAHLEFIKGHLLKFSSNFLEGANYLKAFSDGITGCDCEAAYSGCGTGEPKLTKQYQEMRALQQPQSIASGAQSDVAAGAAEQQVNSTPSGQDEPRSAAQKASKSTVSRVVYSS